MNQQPAYMCTATENEFLVYYSIWYILNINFSIGLTLPCVLWLWQVTFLKLEHIIKNKFLRNRGCPQRMRIQRRLNPESIQYMFV